MDLLELAYEVAAELKGTEEYKRLLVLKKQMELEYAPFLKAFAEAKAKYASVMEYGEYHPDMKMTRQELVFAKQQLYELPLVIEYKQLERQMQEKIDLITAKLNETIRRSYRQIRIKEDDDNDKEKSDDCIF